MQWAKDRAMDQINEHSGFAGRTSFKHDMQKHDDRMVKCEGYFGMDGAEVRDIAIGRIVGYNNLAKNFVYYYVRWP